MKPDNNDDKSEAPPVAHAMPTPLSFCDVAALEAAFGAPAYSYFKEWVQASGAGRNRRHYGSGYNEIPKEEYDANHAISRRTETARFMGTHPVGSFYRYQIRLKTAGWPQALAKQLKEMDDAICYPKE
jgi:hypothetical protein